MNQHERNQPDEGPHHNPAIVEWLAPEEGVEVRLRLNHPRMETLPDNAREKLELALQRFALMCEFVVAEQDVIAERGITIFGSLNGIAEFIGDLSDFYKEMAQVPLFDDNDFPF